MKNFLCCFILTCFFTGKSFSQFDWKNTGGPYGSGSSFIYSNDTYAFIPENDFLYRSDDGIHWEKLEHRVSDHLGVYHDTLANTFRDESLGLIRFQISFDNGVNWVEKNLPNEISDLEDMVMCSHGIYVAQGLKAKIYKSSDLGDTWDSLPAPDSFTVMKVFEDRLYISGDSLLWRTDPYGENWIDITPPLPAPFPFFTHENDFVALDSHLLVATDDSLFISHDNGQSWDATYAYSTNEYDKMTIVGSYIYLNIIGALFRTSDFGIHWDTIVTSYYPRAIHLTGLRDIFLSTTYDRGVIRWDESAGEIVESNEGLNKGVVYDLAYGANKIWAACGNGVFVYDIQTAAWSNKMNLPLTKIENSFVSANDEGWVISGEYYADQFYLSEDQGATWDTIQPGFEITDMQLLEENIFMFSGKVYRSLDKGQHWDTLDFGIMGNELISFHDKKFIVGQGRLHFTTDNGLTWNSINTPIGFNKLYAYADKLYALTSDFISKTDLYISEDAIHWKYADESFPDIDIYTLYYHYHPLFFRDANYHYAFLGDIGHYISADGGLSWSPLETTQTGRDYLIHENKIYLGSEGMYSTVIEDPYTTGLHDPLDSYGNLFTISPNPANDFISIGFEAGITRKGNFQIFSPDGIKVKSIKINEAKGNITIPVQDLSVGLYYVLFNGENVIGVNSFVKLP